MIKLDAELVLELYVNCKKDLEVGSSYNGLLKVIPIVGGHFNGKLKGRVISGGADWNTSKGNGISHAFAKYLIQTDDGEYIAIENEGLIDNKIENSIIRTSPKFITNKDSRYSWLNYGVYVGSLEPGLVENQVHIKIYKMM